MTKIHKKYSLFWSVVEVNERATEKVGLIVKPYRLIDILEEVYINDSKGLERIMGTECEVTRNNNEEKIMQLPRE